MPTGTRAGYPVFWQVQKQKAGLDQRKSLFIHCMLGSSRAWHRVVPHLTDHASLVSFDLPGHGNSADWDERGEYQTVCTEIARDFLNGPADLVGHSFGATVALRLAVENPDLVRSLTLIEPVYFAALRGTDALSDHLAEFAPVVDAHTDGDLEGAGAEFTRFWGDGTPWVDLPKAQRAAITKRIHLILAHHRAIYDDPAGVLGPGQLENLNVPVLLLEGAFSPSVIGVIQERLCTRLPNARRQIVAEARHLLPMTHAGNVAGHIKQFWGEIPVC